jgi:hypothetical protein
MTRFILAALSGFFFLSATAFWAAAQDLTIYTGREGGGYDAKARELAQRLAQRQINASIENRNGSDDITLQACRNPQSLWIAQKDALWLREQNDGCYLVDLGLYGEEVAMLFFPPGTSKNELSDIDSSDKILVDRIGSGSELSWKTMVKIEKEFGRNNEWASATTVAEAVTRAQSLASRGEIDAVFLVRTTNSKDFERLIEQGWRLGELYDRDINDLQYGSRPLYESREIELRFGGKDYLEYGYVIPSFIGTTEQVERSNPELFDTLLNALQ